MTVTRLLLASIVAILAAVIATSAAVTNQSSRLLFETDYWVSITDEVYERPSTQQALADELTAAALLQAACSNSLAASVIQLDQRDAQRPITSAVQSQVLRGLDSTEAKAAWSRLNAEAHSAFQISIGITDESMIPRDTTIRKVRDLLAATIQSSQLARIVFENTSSPLISRFTEQLQQKSSSSTSSKSSKKSCEFTISAADIAQSGLPIEGVTPDASSPTSIQSDRDYVATAINLVDRGLGDYVNVTWIQAARDLPRVLTIIAALLTALAMVLAPPGFRLASAVVAVGWTAALLLTTPNLIAAELIRSTDSGPRTQRILLDGLIDVAASDIAAYLRTYAIVLTGIALALVALIATLFVLRRRRARRSTVAS